MQTFVLQFDLHLKSVCGFQVSVFVSIYTLNSVADESNFLCDSECIYFLRLLPLYSILMEKL